MLQGLLAGVTSGVGGGIIAAVVTASSATVFPIVALPAAFAVGNSVAGMASGINRSKLEETLCKYEKEFLAVQPNGTKREAFEYAKKKIMGAS